MVEIFFTHPRAAVVNFAISKLLTRIFHDRLEKLYPFVFGDARLLSRMILIYEKQLSPQAPSSNAFADLLPLIDQIVLKLRKHKIDYVSFCPSDFNVQRYKEIESLVASQYTIKQQHSSKSANRGGTNSQKGTPPERRLGASSKNATSLSELVLKSGGSTLHNNFKTTTKNSPQITQPSAGQLKEKERLLITLATAPKSMFDTS